MIKQAKRTTIYLDPDIHKLMKFKALEESRSLSELINEAIRRELAEDLEDIAAFEKYKDEGTITYEELLKELKADGKI